MASLLYKEGMRGKVNLIYMDPPYNKSFRSNFQADAEFQRRRRTGTTSPTTRWLSGLQGRLP